MKGPEKGDASLGTCSFAVLLPKNLKLYYYITILLYYYVTILLFYIIIIISLGEALNLEAPSPTP